MCFLAVFTCVQPAVGHTAGVERGREAALLLSLSPRLPVCLSPALRTAAAASVCVQQQHPTDPQLEADFLRKHNKNNARIEQYSRQISLTTSGSTPLFELALFSSTVLAGFSPRSSRHQTGLLSRWSAPHSRKVGWMLY